jgi:ATP-dependent RNA helicase DeaD
MVRLYMDIGRSNGVRPADVVYSIASQANIPGRSIGAINIRKYETYLDVPEAHANTVLHAMQHGTIRGNAMTMVRAEGVFNPSAS